MKDKLPLFVGIGLPLLLVAYIVLSTYIPSLFVKPKYNFIYATGYYYNYNISTVNGKITVSPTYSDNQSYSNTSTPTFYLYDVSNDKSTQITTGQTQAYNVDPSNKSPDGFTVETSYGGGGFFPFWYDSYDGGYYLKGHGLNKKIQILGDTYQFKLIGWVTNE